MGNWNSCQRPSGMLTAFSIYLILRRDFTTFYYYFGRFTMFFAPEMIVLALEFHFSRLRHIYFPPKIMFTATVGTYFNLPDHRISIYPFNLPYVHDFSIYRPHMDFNFPIDCPSGNVDLQSVWDFNLPSQHDFNLPSDNFNLPGHRQPCDFNLPSDNFNSLGHCVIFTVQPW